MDAFSVVRCSSAAFLPRRTGTAWTQTPGRYRHHCSCPDLSMVVTMCSFAGSVGSDFHFEVRLFRFAVDVFQYSLRQFWQTNSICPGYFSSFARSRDSASCRVSKANQPCIRSLKELVGLHSPCAIGFCHGAFWRTQLALHHCPEQSLGPGERATRS